jgi:HprK-related kinase A
LAGFEISIRSSLPQVSDGLSLLYADYLLGSADGFTDFELRIDSPSLSRRLIRPQVNFSCNDFFPFKPLPINQAFAMFEWGLNWVIANHCHQFAIIHSAVVEKNDKGLILPGTPGSGKSTLCAALVCKGWRLLSDEMALISLETNQIHPFPRPIGLKNNSIEIIQAFGEKVVFGRTVNDTAKGSVAHMRAPQTSINADLVTAPPFAVVFPKYQPNVELNFAPISKGETMMQLAGNCFNYPVLGADGFHCLANVADSCSGHILNYSKLDGAIAALDKLFSNTAP